jgi:hypothetical protein
MVAAKVITVTVDMQMRRLVDGTLLHPALP